VAKATRVGFPPRFEKRGYQPSRVFLVFFPSDAKFYKLVPSVLADGNCWTLLNAALTDR
jgi:hypothetical protein